MTRLTLIAIMPGLKLFAAAAVLVAALGSTAQAAEPPATCGTHKDLTAYLTSQYSEEVQSLGLTANGMLIELYVSPKATWSAVLTTPQGLSCLVAAGTDWESNPIPRASLWIEAGPGRL